MAVMLTVTGMPGVDAQAAGKPAFNKKSVTLKKGKTTTLMLKNASGKVKWSIDKKKIASLKVKNKNTVQIKAKKPGKAKITAKLAGKKYICRLTVKNVSKPAEQNAVTGPTAVTAKTAAPVMTSQAGGQTMAPQGTATVPGASSTPDPASVVTETPSSSGKPVVSDMPEDTKKPETTEAPAGTKSPSETAKPSKTVKPSQTHAPSMTRKPVETKAPASSGVPQQTKAPQASPKVTEKPVMLISGAESTDQKVQKIDVYQSYRDYYIEVLGDIYSVKEVRDSIQFTYGAGDARITNEEYKQEAFQSDSVPGYYVIEVTGTVNGKTVTQTYFLIRSRQCEPPTTAQPPQMTANPEYHGGLIADAASGDDRVQAVTVYNDDERDIHFIEVFGDFKDIQKMYSSIGFSFASEDAEIVSAEYSAEAYFSDGAPGYYRIEVTGTLDGQTVTQTYFLGRVGYFDLEVMENDNAKIMDYSGWGEHLVIPAVIDGYQVTDIDDAAFAYAKGFQKVILSEGIENIGTKAFYGCDKLTSVRLPESLDSLGGEAFGGCSELTDINIPESLTDFGGFALTDTPWFDNKLTASENKMVIVNHVLIGVDYEETDVVIPDGVTVIAPEVFLICTNLQNLTIPESVNLIGEDNITAEDSVQLWVQEGSYAQSFAVKNGLSYKLLVQ